MVSSYIDVCVVCLFLIILFGAFCKLSVVIIVSRGVVHVVYPTLLVAVAVVSIVSHCFCC